MDKSQGGIHVSAVEPVDQPHREKVFATIGILGAETKLGHRFFGEPRHRDLDQAIVFHRGIFKRTRVQLRELEILFLEAIFVDDQQSSFGEVCHVRDQCGGVHRDQSVERIARRVDLVRSKLDLESRNPSAGSSRRPNLRWKVREGCDVVSKQRRCVRQLLTEQLHTITRVTHQSHGDSTYKFNRLLGRRERFGRHCFDRIEVGSKKPATRNLRRAIDHARMDIACIV